MAALFVIAKKFKQHSYVSTDEKINKMWSICTKGMLIPHGWTLKTLSERNQTQKATYYHSIFRISKSVETENKVEVGSGL